MAARICFVFIAVGVFVSGNPFESEDSEDFSVFSLPYKKIRAQQPPPNEPVLLPLTRRVGDIKYGDAHGVRSHFVAQVRLGLKDGEAPLQEMDVVFDTSSGQVILPAVGCEDPACKDRKLYSPAITGGTVVTKTRFGDSVEAQIDMVDFDVGQAKGFFEHDKVCFGPTQEFGDKSMDTCLDMNLLAATQLSDKPFVKLPFDGVVGMGLEGLSISSLFNFFSTWDSAAKEGERETYCSLKGYARQFAFYFPPDRVGPGELALGGHVASHLASPLVWVPVDKPEEGYWMINIKAIRIGNETLGEACPQDGCWGLIDTSSSRLGVPADAFPALNRALSLPAPRDSCRGGPELRLVLGSGEELVFEGEDYGVLAEGGCTPELVPLRQMPRDHVYVLGETVLRRYYTVFDWAEKRVGFGLARHSGVSGVVV